MTQSESEQQLQIWKDLAISKQMIMNEAAAQLKLKAEWTQEELKEALDNAIKRSKNADVDMQRTRYEADKAVSDMQDQLTKAEKARVNAESERDSANQAKEQAESQLANGRKDNAEALKKAKQQVIEKDKELKAINTALADTPENVLKKLKNLKKQKHEETQARTKSDEANRKLKKEVKNLQETVDELEALKDKGRSLVEQYRELRDFCEKQQEALKSASIDAEDLPAIDYALMDGFEDDPEVEDSVKKAAAHA